MNVYIYTSPFLRSVDLMAVRILLLISRDWQCVLRYRKMPKFWRTSCPVVLAQTITCFTQSHRFSSDGKGQDNKRVALKHW